MEFVKNDLALIPDDQLVVLMMHIPLDEVGDRKELFQLIPAASLPACPSRRTVTCINTCF